MPSEIFPTHPARRRFLKQTLAFSALAALGSLDAPAFAGPSPHGAAEMLFIGDWGYENDHAGQIAVAQAMRSYARLQSVKPQAFLLLGDNWYGDLTGGVHSPRWQSQFEDMYPRELFDCPAYAILGNHDYQNSPQSKVDAELEYARTAGSRWTMPARWYRFAFPAHKPLITFLALDSNMPNPRGPQAGGHNFTLTEEQRVQQQAWLEGELAKPRTTPFLAVIAHHPIYSDGAHGDHAMLIRDWDPLLRKHNVALYMAGHDHDLQHLEFEGHPTSFFLSGGGGADLYDLKIDPSKRGPYAQKIYGFSHLSATAHALTLRHIDSNGRVLHAFTKTVDGKISLA